MALQRLPGSGVWYPYRLQPPALALSFSTTALIDATGEKTAVSGPVWFADRTGSKTLTGVGWRAGAIVSAGGSAITVSAQDVSTAAGPPQRPDETQDQTVTAALSTLTANGWNTSTFSTTRSVSYGDKLSIVWEFDGSGRLGADSLIVSHLALTRTRPQDVSNVLLKTGGSWAVSSQNAAPNIVLIFSDGSFGTLSGSFVCSDIGTITLNTGTTPDEVAMQLSLPMPCKIDASEVYLERATGADWSMVLYSGTTALQTHVAGVRNHSGNANETRNTAPQLFPGEQELTANTLYRVSVKPTTANDVTVPYFDVAAAGHLVCHGGSDFHFWSRTDGGAWGGQNTTRNVLLNLRISALDDGASGSGGDAGAGSRFNRGLN